MNIVTVLQPKQQEGQPFGPQVHQGQLVGGGAIRSK
jgi:hypothetical protein